MACAPEAKEPEPYWAEDDRACNAGNVEACIRLGQDFGQNIFDDEKLEKSYAAFGKACKLGFAKGCTYVGEKTVHKGNREAGYALIEKGCELGDTAACSSASMGFENGYLGYPKDPERARRLRELACKAGDDVDCMKEIRNSYADATRMETLALDLVCRKPSYPCEELAGQELVGQGRSDLRWAYHDKVNAPRGKAMRELGRSLFERACAKKQPYGCINYALVAFDEDAGPVEPKHVIALLSEPCTEAGEDAVCFAHGRANIMLKLTEPAKQAFLRPCRDGSADRCEFEEARAFAAAKRYDVAGPLFSRECTAGTAKACVESGKILFVQKNPAAAATAFRKACDGNVAAGCTRLGALYAAGQGVSVDRAKAAKLFDKACSLGDSDACPIASNPESIAAIGKNLGELGAAIGQGVWDGLVAPLGRFAFDLFFLWPLEGTIKVLNAVTGH